MIQAITSFPRSGSHLTKQYFTSLSGISCRLNHSPIKLDGSISCIRNPQESISSILTMELKFCEYKLQNADLCKNKDVVDLFLNTKIKMLMHDYKVFYEFLALSNHLLIEYNDLIKNPEQKILEVLFIKNIKPLDEPQLLVDLKDNLEQGYVVKSKPFDIYNYVFEFTSNHIDNDSLAMFDELCKLSKKQI